MNARSHVQPSTYVDLSTQAIALLIADGQLENAIAEERRWKLHEADACNARLNARDQVIKWQTRIADLKRSIGAA